VIGGDAADVVVLGAGVSGLAAAVRLAEAGCSVRIVEARDGIGGRIQTRRGGHWPVPIELGAEFVQGRIPSLFALAHDARLPVIELRGERWLWRAGQLARRKDFRAPIERILTQLAELRADEDRSVAQILDASHQGRALMRSWIESYDAAHLDRFSIRALERERKAEAQLEGDRVFRLVSGYDGIPQALHARLPSSRAQVHLATVATEVHWSPRSVRVDTRGPDGRTSGPFYASRLVVTLPLGVLQAPPTEKATVRFDPPLAEKERALQGLEMGNVVKLVFAFKERVWDRLFPGELGFLTTPDEPFRGWWSGYPVIAPVLAAWAGGPAADVLGGLTRDQRADLALDSLARALKMDRAILQDQVVAWETHDWAADPFARGAYSYVRVGGMQAQAALAQPVESTLFFAGEATELAGHQATVHGAIATGERAADEVLRSLHATSG
jgi:monoamine oxidase